MMMLDDWNARRKAMGSSAEEMKIPSRDRKSFWHRVVGLFTRPRWLESSRSNWKPWRCFPHLRRDNWWLISTLECNKLEVDDGWQVSRHQQVWRFAKRILKSHKQMSIIQELNRPECFDVPIIFPGETTLLKLRSIINVCVAFRCRAWQLSGSACGHYCSSINMSSSWRRRIISSAHTPCSSPVSALSSHPSSAAAE